MSRARPAAVVVATLLTVTAAVGLPISPLHSAEAAPGNAAAPAAPDRAAALPSSHYTRSYYMGDAGFAAARNLGCANGDKTGRMTLYFGAPTAVAGTYGATLWSAPDRTTEQVGAVVKEFARGYAFCRRSSSYTLFIGVGTSNSGIDARSEVWVEAHGRKWASMVRNLRAWSDRYYRGRFSIYAAWDAEPSWSRYAKAEHWMHGYNSQPGRVGVHVNNAADGCSTTSSNNAACDNGWSQYWLWRLSWQYDPALPMPQIYTTTGSMARQWHQIDLFGVGRGDGMYFYGVMSQRAACSQAGAWCPGTNNTPQAAHDQMLWYSNTHPATRQNEILSPTNINWHS